MYHRSPVVAGDLAILVEYAVPRMETLAHGKEGDLLILALAFTVDVQHAVDLSKALNGHGIRSTAIWGGSHPVQGKIPDRDLARIYDDFRHGRIDVICSCSMIGEGADFPMAMCGLMARPTQSGLLFRQNIGRILRPYPAAQGKREYQQKCLNAVLRAVRDRGCVDQLLVLATGTGKTWIAAQAPKLVNYWKGAANRGRILFLVHMDILAKQAADKFAEINPTLRVGVEKAGQQAGDADIVIGSVQTLGPPNTKTGNQFNSRLRSFNPDRFDVLFVDETHRAVKSTYHHSILRWFRALKSEPDCRDKGLLHCGLTATPQRTDNLGMELLYQQITFQYGIKDAITEGYLAPIVAHRVETQVDISAVKNSRMSKDFAIGELEETVNTPERNELVAEKYLEICRLEGMEGSFDPTGFVKPHAVVVDFVDVTAKHQLITTPSLFGLRGNFNARGKDVLKQAEQVEKIRQENPTLDLSAQVDMEGIEAYLKRVDLMAPPDTPPEIRRVSRLPWISYADGYSLGLMDHSILMVRENALGQYELARHMRGVRSLLSVEPDLKHAMKEADKIIPDRDASILRAVHKATDAPPTEKQCGRVWMLDRRLREIYRTDWDYYRFCQSQFESGNAGFSKSGMSARIDSLTCQRTA